MPVFAVDLSNVVYASSSITAELSENELAGFTEQSLAEGLFPDGILGVTRASISPDDSVYRDGMADEDDFKGFVSITLLVEAESAEQIDCDQDFTPPTDLLTKITDMIAPSCELESVWDLDAIEPHVQGHALTR